jgi:competence protein ComEC
MNIRTYAVSLLLLLVLVGIAAFIWIHVFENQSSSDKLTVAFFDVGQGDALYIESPTGVQVLIDGGVDKGVLRELATQMSFWDRSIDLVIATHPDNDHIGGLPSVLERFEVELFLEPGVYADNGTYDELIATSIKEEVTHEIAITGQRFELGGGVYLDILFPDRELPDIDANAASIIAKLTYGQTSFLFTGDAPKAIEKHLVALYGDALDVNVLKLGHHGSNTSSALEFLGYTAPQIAVISASADNSYGHPHTEVLERLEQLEIAYVNTADEGTIVFESDGRDIVRK